MAVHNFESLLGQVVGITNNLWNELASTDGWGHLPIGAKNDVVHGVAEHRSVVVSEGLADNHLHRRPDVEVLVVGAKAELGNICHDGGLSVSARQPPPSFERELHLLNALAQWDVQIRHCPSINSSTRFSPKPALKIHNRTHQSSLVFHLIRRNAGVRWQVANQTQ